MLSYYAGAIGRSWGNAWDWLTGQGIILTWLLGGGVVIASLIITAVKAARKPHSWDTAIRDAKKSIWEFSYTTVLSLLAALFVVFIIFFVRDAPTQLAIMNERLTQAQADVRVKEKQLDDRKAKHKLRDDLSNVLAEGYLLLNRFPLTEGGTIPEDEFNNWTEKVLTVFRENNMDNSNWVRLLDSTILGQLANHPPQTPQAKAYINLLTMTTNLQKLLKECD